MARHAEEPADALGDDVVGRTPSVGAGLAEARDRAVDDVRADRADRVVAAAEPVRGAWPEVLHHDVTPGGQGKQGLEPVRVLEVDRDTALVPVDLGEAVAFAVTERPHGPRVVAAGQPFYLDHIRPKVAKNHGRV